MKKKSLKGLKLKLNILRGLLFGVLLLALLSLSSTCFANSDEDLIESMLDEKISYLQTYMNNNFKANDYVILKSTSNSNMFAILLAKDSFRNISYSNNDLSTQFNGGGYVLWLQQNPWGPTINLLERNDQVIDTERGYNIIFAKDYNNYSQTNILYNYFFMAPLPEPEPEVPAIFDGVIESYDNGIVPVGTITPNPVDLKYFYDINTTYPSPNIHGTIHVYLEELTPGEAIQQTPYSVNYPTEENGFIKLATSNTNYPYRYTVKYRDLLSYMKNNYIYRLQIGFVQENVSGDVNSLNRIVYTDICTSEFFSKDSWYSDKILVKNIYKLVGESNLYSGEEGILSVISSGDSGDKISQGIFDIQNSLVDLNKNITGTIDNVILGTPNESGDRQGGLVGNLLEGLWSGLIHLFVPDSEEFSTWLNNSVTSLSSRGGFLLYSQNFWLSLINLMNNEESSDFILNIPEFSLPNLRFWCKWSSNLGG